MGTVSLLAGIDLVSGRRHASVAPRHRSREFIADLERFDAAYPPQTAIKIVLDNTPPTNPRKPRLGSRRGPRGASLSYSRQARLLAQSDRGILLQAREVRA